MNKLYCLIVILMLFAGCTKKNDDIGTGPIKKIELGELDRALSEKGMQIFDVKCSMCHAVERTTAAPNLSGITKRQTPEWILNMMLNPEQMAKDNPTAKAQSSKFPIKMSNQNITQEDARAILEYLRSKDSK